MTKAKKVRDRKKANEKRAKLLKAIGLQALQVEREAYRMHVVLLGMAKPLLKRSAPAPLSLPIGPTPPPSSSSDPGSLGDFLTGWYYDQLAAALAEPGGNFDAACRELLEGAATAARAGNNAGAARAYNNYLKCLRRPRPLHLAE